MVPFSVTISARTSPSAAANGRRSPKLPSLSPVNPYRIPAIAPPSSWSASPPPPLPPLRLSFPAIPSSETVRDELEHLAGALWHRIQQREHRGGYNAGNRCWGCNLFIGGATVTCPHCGQQHGGIYHDAYATR